MTDIDRQIEQIKARLVLARERAGLTQTQAAQMVGMSFLLLIIYGNRKLYGP